MLDDVEKLLRPGVIGTIFPDLKDFTPDIAGFGWCQGWNDGCSINATAAYETNLVNLISDSLFDPVYSLDIRDLDVTLNRLVAEEYINFARVYDARGRIMRSAGEDQAPPADILENLITTASQQQLRKNITIRLA